MLEEVPSSVLSKELPRLRDHIGNGDFEPLPFTRGKRKEIIGQIVPVWLVRAYQQYLHSQNKALILKKGETRQLSRKVNEENIFLTEDESAPLCYIVPIAARDNRPAQMFALIDERVYSKIYNLQRNNIIPWEHPVSTLNDDTPLNMTSLEKSAVPQSSFWSNFKELRKRIADNTVTFRRSMDMVAIPLTVGQNLKKHAAFGDARIIKKIPSKQSERSSAQATDMVNAGHYLHVNGMISLPPDIPNDHMVIPALVSEFLVFCSGGEIKGIREQKTKPIGITFTADLSSDFKKTVHINPQIKTEAQRQIVERALQHLRDTQDTISLCGQKYKITATKKDRFKNIDSKFSIPTQVRFSSTLSIQGDFKESSIEFGSAADIADISLKMAQHCDLHFNGTVYSLNPV